MNRGPGDERGDRVSSGRNSGGPYTGEHLQHVAFPLGGIGAGMVCLEGAGAISHVSLRHHPETTHEPLMLAALHLKQAGDASRSWARVLEGPVPRHKPFRARGDGENIGSGSGAPMASYGLPRFGEASFEAHFPFATIALRDPAIPVEAEIVGWSPFTPGDSDDSSLPFAALDYRIRNVSPDPMSGVFSFHSANLMFALGGGERRIRAMRGGFALVQQAGQDLPSAEGSFAAWVDDPETRVNARWFRGGWFDPITVVWKGIEEGSAPEAAPYSDGHPGSGASLSLSFELGPGQERTIPLRFAWYVPRSDLATGSDPAETHRPWYAERYADLDQLVDDLKRRDAELRKRTALFSDVFHDTTLPDEVVEAVGANLAILRSPTVLRQADGRLWAWEGCSDRQGCCSGSCTHVWNYAQALPHLFPDLERSLRETEFGECQDEEGHGTFRAPLPIRPATHDFHAAADGQLGGVLKVHRDWRISGDAAWLARLWPQVERSLAYATRTWDPERIGLLREPHHNTYDIEFWGADGMCSSIYLAALQAAAAMAEAVGSDPTPYRELYQRGRQRVEQELFDGEYFVQRVDWKGLRAPPPTEAAAGLWNVGYSPEAEELLSREGPKYQYGTGCLSDGVIGAWLARVCGVGEILEPEQVRSHLRAIHQHNLKRDLSSHANPQRSGYAFGTEGGLLLCTWPKGGKPTLPFVYSDEVWTGIEYQVASHLILEGMLEEGLEIVRIARSRYDGRMRNPFDEIECGHWYARALSSYALLQACSGARYDAVERILHLTPAVPGDFRAFLATAGGFGTVGVRGGEPFLGVRSGEIPVEEIRYRPAEASDG
ncbi:MAG: hypothetical protein GY723_14650 [bacterium]|nr:hypothetical protein [bacterium]